MVRREKKTYCINEGKKGKKSINYTEIVGFYFMSPCDLCYYDKNNIDLGYKTFKV